MRHKKNLALYTKALVFFYFLFLCFIYIGNITRDVFGADVGDLVTAAYVAGVPHPPGYPLFTLLGFIFTHLPLPIPPVSSMALISVFSSIGGLFFYYKFSQKVSRSVAISLLSTSILAFSYLFWLYTEIPEVFAFNNFFAILILYISFLFYETKNIKYFYLLVFLCALSLTHHTTIILLFPGVSILILARVKLILREKKKLIFVPLIALLGMFPYIYIPIAASRNPIINWGTVVDFDSFINLILRKDYSWKAGAGVSAPIEHGFIILKYYFLTLKSSFTIPTLLVVCLGAITLLKAKKIILASFLLAFLISGPFAMFYISGITTYTFGLGIRERFFSLSIVSLAFFLPYGFSAINNYSEKFLPIKKYSMLVIFTFFIIPVLLFMINNQKTDFSNSNLVNKYSMDLISNLPPNSILFLYGDMPTFGVWYLHYVLGVRPDITIAPRDPGNGGINPFWDKEIKEFSKKHPKIKDNEKIISEILAETAVKRPVFGVEQYEVSPSFFWVRRGLVYQLVRLEDIPPENEYLTEAKKIWESYDIPTSKTLLPSERNFISTETLRVYSYALSYTGNFIDFMYGDLKEAGKYYKKAIEVDPTNPEAYGQLGYIEYMVNHDCKRAAEFEWKAIENSFINLVTSLPYYVHLHNIYDRCNEGKLLKKLRADYSKQFGKDLRKISEGEIILRF